MLNPELRKPQYFAYKLGAVIGLLCLAVLLLPSYESLHVHGPMNSGHDPLKCAACHQDAPGNMRQQIQANLRYALGLRAQMVDFGKQAVTNETCLGCHERPNDRHPVYRFLEPRFLKAREALSPHTCMSCHAEHKGQRVTRTEIGFCQNCHKKTKLRKDPLDVPHDQLIKNQRWESCLGCHDFHGNHIMETKKLLNQAIPAKQIWAYFQGGTSPYGDRRHYKAKKEANHD